MRTLSQADMLLPQGSPPKQATTFSCLRWEPSHLLLLVLSALQRCHAHPSAGPKLSETVKWTAESSHREAKVHTMRRWMGGGSGEWHFRWLLCLMNAGTRELTKQKSSLSGETKAEASHSFVYSTTIILSTQSRSGHSSGSEHCMLKERNTN